MTEDKMAKVDSSSLTWGQVTNHAVETTITGVR